MLKGLRLRLTIIFTAFTGLVLAAVLAVSLALNLSQMNSENEQWFSNNIDSMYAHIQTTSLDDGSGVILEQEPYIIVLKRDGEAMDVASGWTPRSDRTTLFEAVKATAEERGLTDWLNRSYLLMVKENVALEGAIATVEDIQPNWADDTTVQFEDSDAAAPADPEEVELEKAKSAQVFYSTSVISGDEGIFNQTIDGVRYRSTYFEFQPRDSSGSTLASHEGVDNVQLPGPLYQVAILEDLSEQTRTTALTCVGFALLFLAGVVLLFLANWMLARLVLRPTEEGIKRQADFVAAASHELRSPLAVVRSSLSAARAAECAAEAERYRTAAEREAERMSRLIDDLLLLAGSDAKTWPVEQCEVDLDTVLIGTSEQMLPQAREQQVRLRLNLPEETLPRLKGDADRLRQILGALLDNALQYAPAGSEVMLAATLRRGKVKLQVIDHGPGISDDDKQRIFGRFYRADVARGNKAHFGLGLSVARELAGLHGGKLTVEDTPGGGATFTLVLPRQ